MKSILTFSAVLAITLNSFAWKLHPPVANQPPSPEAQLQSYIKRERVYFKPAFPYREIDGTISYAKGPKWVQFVGRVIQVHPNNEGVRVRGWYGPPMSWNGDALDEEIWVTSTAPGLSQEFIPLDREFFIRNFPFEAYENATFTWSQKLVARIDEPYQYNTATSTRTIPCLNFGTITNAPQPVPLTEEQEKALQKSRELKALDSEQRLAEKGNAYGEYKMGMRYWHGDGVETNRPKAMDLLGKASLKGNEPAKAALKQLLAE